MSVQTLNNGQGHAVMACPFECRGGITLPCIGISVIVIGEIGKIAIIFAKMFAISVYAWYTVWALIDEIQKCTLTGEKWHA